MADKQDNLKSKIEEASSKAKEFAEKHEVEAKIKDLKVNAEELAEKARVKFEESGIKEKVLSQFTEENKAVLAEKSKKVYEFTKSFALANKEMLKKAAIGVASLSAVAVVASVVFDAEHTISYKERGEDKTFTYFYDESKIFGTALVIGSEEEYEITEDAMSLRGLSNKLKDVINKSTFNHPRSRTIIEDVAFTLVFDGFMKGDNEYYVFKPAKFEFKGQDVKGFDLYIVNDNQTYTAKKPLMNVIYTQYY